MGWVDQDSRSKLPLPGWAVAGGGGDAAAASYGLGIRQHAAQEAAASRADGTTAAAAAAADTAASGPGGQSAKSSFEGLFKDLFSRPQPLWMIWLATMHHHWLLGRQCGPDTRIPRAARLHCWWDELRQAGHKCKPQAILVCTRPTTITFVPTSKVCELGRVAGAS